MGGLHDKRRKRSVKGRGGQQSLVNKTIQEQQPKVKKLKKLLQRKKIKKRRKLRKEEKK